MEDLTRAGDEAEFGRLLVNLGRIYLNTVMDHVGSGGDPITVDDPESMTVLTVDAGNVSFKLGDGAPVSMESSRVRGLLKPATE